MYMYMYNVMYMYVEWVLYYTAWNKAYMYVHTHCMICIHIIKWKTPLHDEYVHVCVHMKVYEYLECTLYVRIHRMYM